MKRYINLFLFLIFGIVSFAQKQEISKKAKESAKQKIESYRLRVIKGEKMKDLATQYSEDPGSAKNGGMYYGVKKGVMDPAFESVAFSLKQGQVSSVFETVYGYHFIQLVQRRGEVLDLRHILVIPKQTQ